MANKTIDIEWLQISDSVNYTSRCGSFIALYQHLDESEQESWVVYHILHQESKNILSRGPKPTSVSIPEDWKILGDFLDRF